MDSLWNCTFVVQFLFPLFLCMALYQIYDNENETKEIENN